jgi:NAD(P) transhydrogenase subunit alpha
VDVLVVNGAGDAAFHPDDGYTDVGAATVPAEEVVEKSDVLLCVGPPAGSVVTTMHEGQALIGLLGARQNLDLMRSCAAAGVTAISLELLPRTLSRAQSMDALTSQANVAGYKAVLVAAAAYGRFFPMLMTAAGTHKPAQVLVLGAGVAGLQAIGTARRLGSQVTGYDVRPDARNDVASLGARFLELPGVASAGGEGGYARALTAEEQEAQQHALDDRVASFDVVITTAQVPGRTPPVLVTERAIEAMRPGSVIVDLAAGPLGGNVRGSRPDETLVLGKGVTVIGAPNLPSAMADAASASYARNLTALLALFVHDGSWQVDLTDEVQAAVVVTNAGEIVNPTVAEAAGGAE